MPNKYAGGISEASLLCEDCGREGRGPGGHYGLLRNASVKISNPRYSHLLLKCVRRIPESGHRIWLQTEIRTRRRGNLPGVVGLTTFSIGGYAPNGVTDEVSGSHIITFYTNLLDQLSDGAVTAVMAHELAHAWLNEHLRPEASRTREDDADMLAEMWGFEEDLAALSAETDPVGE